MRMDTKVQVPFKVVPSCKSVKGEVCALPLEGAVILICRCHCTRYSISMNIGD